MNAKVRDLMTESVITVEPDATIDRVRRILQRNKVGALPVVGPDGQPVGIVSATDLVASLQRNSRVSAIMTEKVYTVPKYSGVSVAARIMRNHKIHRLGRHRRAEGGWSDHHVRPARAGPRSPMGYSRTPRPNHSGRRDPSAFESAAA